MDIGVIRGERTEKGKIKKRIKEEGPTDGQEATGAILVDAQHALFIPLGVRMVCVRGEKTENIEKKQKTEAWINYPVCMLIQSFGFCLNAKPFLLTKHQGAS